MKSGEYPCATRYIWQSPQWPALHYNLPALAEHLSEASHAQGLLLGRMARAVGDLFLARGDGSPHRFYSLSAQIQRERRRITTRWSARSVATWT